MSECKVESSRDVEMLACDYEDLWRENSQLQTTLHSYIDIRDTTSDTRDTGTPLQG